MRNGETLFSPAIRAVDQAKNAATGLEYLYESALVPQEGGDGYRLEFDYKKFFNSLEKRLVSFATRKTDYLDITESPTESAAKGEKPHIAHMIVWLGGMGGAPRMILDLANGLKDKYNMEGITLADDFYFKYSNFRVHHFSKPEKTLDFLLSNPPDILHTYYYGDWKGFHKNFEAILKSELPSKIIENLLVPIHIYRSDRINHYIYCSQYIKDIQHEHPNNETVIYPGTNIDEYQPNPERTEMPNSVGMVYRLWDDKIDQSTIEIFISLAKKRPSTLIYIVGGGFNFHHYVERVRQEGVRANFHFSGEIGYRDLHNWYDKFGIFVAPVHNESFGMVVPYAMSKNIPVIGYRRGAIPEILGDTNAIVNTSPEMVDKMIYLLDHPDKAKQIAQDSRERIIAHFSQKKMIKDYDTIYQRLINGG